MSEDVYFPPLENGLDYLQDGVRKLSGAPSPRDLKYAVLHLHAGVEVLLKYRLSCHDWHLVLADDSAATTEQEYEDGQFRSIGTGEALKRLQTLDGIKFTRSQKKAAAALEKFRNQLQHHGLTSTAKAVEAQSAKALGFILDFIDKHITPETHLTSDEEELLADTLPSIRGLLSTITALVDQRMQPAPHAGHRRDDVVYRLWSASGAAREQRGSPARRCPRARGAPVCFLHQKVGVPKGLRGRLHPHRPEAQFL
jgi:hypothetical protein